MDPNTPDKMLGKVRVKSELMSSKKCEYFKIIIRDTQHGETLGTFFGTEAHKYFDIIQPNQTYLFSNFKTQPVKDPRFKCVNSNYEIIFKANSEISEYQAEITTEPELKSFLELSPETFVDFEAYVVGLKEYPQNIQVQLANSNQVKSVSVPKSHAFIQQIYQAKENSSILVCQNLEFKGQNFSAKFGSQFYTTAPKPPKFLTLGELTQSPDKFCKVLANVGNLYSSSEDISEEELVKSKKDKMLYKGCATCKKKFEKERCLKCLSSKSKVFFKAKIQLVDPTGSAKVTAFDSAREVFGCTAEDLDAMDPQSFLDFVYEVSFSQFEFSIEAENTQQYGKQFKLKSARKADPGAAARFMLSQIEAYMGKLS